MISVANPKRGNTIDISAPLTPHDLTFAEDLHGGLVLTLFGKHAIPTRTTILYEKAKFGSQKKCTEIIANHTTAIGCITADCIAASPCTKILRVAHVQEPYLYQCTHWRDDVCVVLGPGLQHTWYEEPAKTSPLLVVPNLSKQWPKLIRMFAADV